MAISRSELGLAWSQDELDLEPRSKARQLRDLLVSPDLRFLMEAHNALSAKIVEEAGFEGIWASGLSISTALGVRDSNEASWSQVLEVLEFMSDATQVPILVDGDTGYGNFNNFRRFVTKLGQRDIAGVCIEDKLFPKKNSFLGDGQALADIDEFCGKIKAGKDSQTDDDFSIVARIEALIAGVGMEEALRRAEAYHAAGADAVLIHSKKSTAQEILSFCVEWANRCPVVIVPTKYYATPTQQFRDAGVSVAIWANHALRASIAAMRDACRSILTEESPAAIEDRIASLTDVFTLSGNEELEQAERRYAMGQQGARAIVLAATRGGALEDLTRDRPKCMLDVRGETLLGRQVRTMRDHGIADVTVVTGYKPEAIDVRKIATVHNPRFATTGEAASLAAAMDVLIGPCIVSYGDILYRSFLLTTLMRSDADIALVVDTAEPTAAHSLSEKAADLVRGSVPFTPDFLDDVPVSLQAIGPNVENPDGRWIGLLKLSARGSGLVRDELAQMAREDALDTASMADLLARLVARGEAPEVIYVTGNWLDVNDAFDLAQARNLS